MNIKLKELKLKLSKIAQRLSEKDKNLIDCIITLQDIIYEVDKIIKETDWIPVTERLPEKGVRVLITADYDDFTEVSIDKFCPVFEMFDNWYCITAWQPLPEPYKS